MSKPGRGSEIRKVVESVKLLFWDNLWEGGTRRRACGRAGGREGGRVGRREGGNEGGREGGREEGRAGNQRPFYSGGCCNIDHPPG